MTTINQTFLTYFLVLLVLMLACVGLGAALAYYAMHKASGMVANLLRIYTHQGDAAKSAEALEAGNDLRLDRVAYPLDFSR